MELKEEPRQSPKNMGTDAIPSVQKVKEGGGLETYQHEQENPKSEGRPELPYLGFLGLWREKKEKGNDYDYRPLIPG